MIDYNVLHNQWLFMALLGGPVLVCAATLTYYAVWRPRAPQGEHIAIQKVTGPVSFLQWWTQFVPWILTLTFAGTAVYAIWYVLAKVANPPNW
jgi:hypothetical protein